jgi:2-keto-3-deoxy-L-rhamnonate aldolase RhmA
MRRSKILEKIRQGQTVCVCNTSFTNSFRVVEMAGRMGYDGVWVDMEHRDFTYQDSAVMTLAARAGDMDAVVRIRKDSYADYFRPLEDGASGIMVPHIKTPAEAEYTVYNAKYAPIGRRGMDGVGADTYYGLSGNDLEKANAETFILIQIEDFEGIDAIEDIVAVEGIGGVLVGPADLAQSYGVAGQPRHEKVLAAMQKVSAAVAQEGKWWGAPGFDPEFVRWLVGEGAQFIAYGGDYGILFQGLQAALEEFRVAAEK